MSHKRPEDISGVVAQMAATLLGIDQASHWSVSPRNLPVFFLSIALESILPSPALKTNPAQTKPKP